MRKMKLVMVGNGMAGVRTLEELLRIAPDLYDITVFGAEPHPNYNRILLSPVLAGEQTIDEIILKPMSPKYLLERVVSRLARTTARQTRKPAAPLQWPANVIPLFGQAPQPQT